MTRIGASRIPSAQVRSTPPRPPPPPAPSTPPTSISSPSSRPPQAYQNAIGQPTWTAARPTGQGPSTASPSQPAHAWQAAQPSSPRPSTPNAFADAYSQPPRLTPDERLHTSSRMNQAQGGNVYATSLGGSPSAAQGQGSNNYTTSFGTPGTQGGSNYTTSFGTPGTQGGSNYTTSFGTPGTQANNNYATSLGRPPSTAQGGNVYATSLGGPPNQGSPVYSNPPSLGTPSTAQAGNNVYATSLGGPPNQGGHVYSNPSALGSPSAAQGGNVYSTAISAPHPSAAQGGNVYSTTVSSGSPAGNNYSSTASATPYSTPPNLGPQRLEDRIILGSKMQSLGEGTYQKVDGSWQKTGETAWNPQMKERLPEYQGEFQEAKFRGEFRTPGGQKIHQSTVQLSDAERNQFQVGGQGGRLVDAGGQNVDTTGARPGLAAAGENRKIFTMDNQGRTHMADASSQMRREGQLSEINPRTGNPYPQKVEHFHHSSLAQGQGVAAAGDMRVQDGWVKEISNESGHYKPGQEQTVQSLDNLHRMGVNTDAAKVNFRDPLGVKTYGAGEFRESRGNTQLLDARADVKQDVVAKANELRAGGQMKTSEQIDAELKSKANPV